MWKVKGMEKFPKKWFEMANAFLEGRPSLTVKGFKTKKQATIFRFEFYAFRTALLREDGSKDYAVLDTLKALIVPGEDGTYNVVFDPRDVSEFANMLDAALSEPVNKDTK